MSEITKVMARAKTLPNIITSVLYRILFVKCYLIFFVGNRRFFVLNNLLLNPNIECNIKYRYLQDISVSVKILVSFRNVDPIVS